MLLWNVRFQGELIHSHCSPCVQYIHWHTVHHCTVPCTAHAEGWQKRVSERTIKRKPTPNVELQTRLLTTTRVTLPPLPLSWGQGGGGCDWSDYFWFWTDGSISWTNYRNYFPFSLIQVSLLLTDGSLLLHFIDIKGSKQVYQVGKIYFIYSIQHHLTIRLIFRLLENVSNRRF